jgi:hypothetical protein
VLTKFGLMKFGKNPNYNEKIQHSIFLDAVTELITVGADEEGRIGICLFYDGQFFVGTF